ncbi:rho GTPase-activating protein-like protein [Sarcoptes scabiei]|uniref:Rho GTPase-activating protein-like protein n=1 Tax=Sarcoptes scabiei TaxID=52283 RepID=A0A132A6N4_SARSC|nr:rho GTPase-activating protein-like protein [Sarcoptes scabiei]
MVMHPDSFRRISGLTSEIFRQLEAVESQFDPSSLSSRYAEMERRGEMIIRILSPTHIPSQWLDNIVRRYGEGINLPSWIQFVEIIKRPGQTLGLYIREGDGIYTVDGVYISRIALESPVYQSGCLRVGDEILAINFVDISCMSLDDVVLIMSIPRRLILVIRAKPLNADHLLKNSTAYETGMSNSYYDSIQNDVYGQIDKIRKPVVVLKQQLTPNPFALDEDKNEAIAAAILNRSESEFESSIPFKEIAARAALRNPFQGDRFGTISDDLSNLAYKKFRRRRLLTLDNLADLNANTYFNNELQSKYLMSNRNPQHSSSSLLYHGRLSATGTRVPDRLIRTSSEQIIFDPESIADDDLLQNNLKQNQYRNFYKKQRHYSFDQSFDRSFRNSHSTQSLSYAQHGMAIPLPGMNEAVAVARKKYLRGKVLEDSPTNAGQLLLQSRSNSLPRTELYSKKNKTADYQNKLNTRLLQLEQFYANKKLVKNEFNSIATDKILPNRPNSVIGRQTSSGQTSSAILSEILDSLGQREAIQSDQRKPLAILNRLNSSSAYDKIRKNTDNQNMTPTHSAKLPTLDLKYEIESNRLNFQKISNSKPKDQNIRSFSERSNETSAEQHQPQFSNNSTSSIGQISTKPSRTLRIDPSGFQQYGPELHKQIANTQNDGQTSGFNGLLVIHLLGVRGLHLDKSPTKSSSLSAKVLYCVVECDRIYKARTAAAQSHELNSSNFDWDEVFDIDLFDTKEISFLFYTWDQSLSDFNLRHKQCSKGTIHLPSISTLTTQHIHAFELRLYDNPGAMFYLKLEYYDLKTTFSRSRFQTSYFKQTTKSLGSNESVLFGEDLSIVLNRESSTLPVPIIIKRCAEEIESRGISILGIYRLCGSSLVKKNLRELFEQDVWLPKISADHVPDINVLTSKWTFSDF